MEEINANDNPPWQVLAIELAVPFLTSIQSLVRPIWDELIDCPDVKICQFSPNEDGQQIFFAAEAKSELDLPKLKVKLESFTEDARYRDSFKSVRVYRYHEIQAIHFGGAKLLPLVSNLYQQQSEAVISTFEEMAKGNSRNIGILALAMNLITLNALNVSDEIRKKALVEQYEGLREDMGDAFVGQEWESTLDTVVQKYRRLEPCFLEGQVHWDALSEFLSEASMSTLRTYDYNIQGVLKKMENVEKMQLDPGVSLVTIIRRRILHSIWLRLMIDNRLEITNVAWLCKVLKV